MAKIAHKVSAVIEFSMEKTRANVVKTFVFVIL